MKIERVSEEDLQAWRTSPVAEAVFECLWKVHKAQKEICVEAYWSGNPWPEADVKALKKQAEIIEDISEATKDHMMELMELIDGKSIGMVSD